MKIFCAALFWLHVGHFADRTGAQQSVWALGHVQTEAEMQASFLSPSWDMPRPPPTHVLCYE